ncbi:nephrin [Trichonephila clavipes]|nr:nephrin [Trichonephila clavipes]
MQNDLATCGRPSESMAIQTPSPLTATARCLKAAREAFAHLQVYEVEINVVSFHASSMAIMSGARGPFIFFFGKDPPSPPKIVGYEEGTPIKSGDFQRFTCVAIGGNPLATLRWFKRDREVVVVRGEDEEDSNDEEYNRKYDSSTELDRDLKEDNVENIRL